MKEKITNNEIKKNNRNRIFRYICKNRETSNPDISYDLKISLPTVIQNTKDFIERGLIKETGALQSTGGRRAKALSVCSGSRLAVGLDITRNHIGLVLINLIGEIIKFDRIYMPYYKGEGYFTEVNEKLENFLESCYVERTHILGIGISLPGVINLQKEEITYSHVLDVENVPFSRMSQHFKFPCYFLNDANAGAYAEAVRAEAPDRFFYLSLSNTVGGAIFSGKKLVLGDDFRCGEVGHMTIVLDGKPCYCGKNGCMDAYCSAKCLSKITDGKLELFFKRLDENDKEAIRIWEEYTTYLSVAVNNIYMALNCNIILGGYVGGYVEKHIQYIRKKVGERNIFSKECDFVKPCTYKIEEAALGAASQVIERFLESV